MIIHRITGVIAASLMVAAGGTWSAVPAGAATHRSHHRAHHRSHHTSGGIPQHNGGDMDADNNGGPSDGDGNV